MVIEITRKKAIALLALIIIFLAIGVTVYLSQQSQDTRSRASEDSSETTVIASVNGEDITKAQVREVAEEQYDPQAVDTVALKDALDVLIERMILDDSASSQDISIDSSLVEERIQNEDLDQNEAFYDLLREEVILKNVRSVRAQSLGFWAPKEADQANLEPSDKTTALAQIASGANAIPEIKIAMGGSSTIEVIAENISTKYSALAPSLTINGYRISELEESEILTISAYKIYEYGDSNLDPSVLSGLFALEVGAVEAFSNTETNAGGYVFKVLEKGNEAGVGTYDEWLSEKIKSEVIMKGTL